MDAVTLNKKKKFIADYKKASNAATGSAYDSNANVTSKNLATMTCELGKKDIIDIRRAIMDDYLKVLYNDKTAEDFKEDLKHHRIYAHDESSLFPYCCSISLYPFILDGLRPIGGDSDAPKHANSFIGGLINLVYAVASQFAGAVAIPEFLCYFDHFLRVDYGDDYLEHLDDPLECWGNLRSTLRDKIEDWFQQLVYSINEPAGARNYQSPFTNIAYFDEYYFKSIYKDFFFPDGDEPRWETTKQLEKIFMKWFNNERTHEALTFPVETANILVEDKKYKDKEMADFFAEMWSEGHSFFMYQSDSVDALASCCFSKNQKVIVKCDNRVYFDTFEHIWNTMRDSANIEILHNGSWCRGTVVKLPNRPMYKIITANNKEIIVSDNHLNLTSRGNVQTSDLTTDDYLLFNNHPLESCSEQDLHLTYEQGFAVGASLNSENLGVNQECEMECLLQSKEYRQGILDGWCNSNGGDSNNCPASSKELCDYIEALITSLGMNSVITTPDRTDENGMYYIRWCNLNNERKTDEVYEIISDNVYSKIVSIEPTDYTDDIYCFKMENKDKPYFTLPNGIITHNCRLRNEVEDNVFSYTLGAGGIQTGSKCVITINLNRNVQDWDKAGRQISLSEYIADITRRVHKYLNAWNQKLWDDYNDGLLPIYKAGFIDLDKQFLTVGM